MVRQSAKFIRLFVKGNKDLAKKYNADVCPHLVFLDPKGAEARVLKKRELVDMKPMELRKKMGDLLGEKAKEAPPAVCDVARKVADAVARRFRKWPR